jgi:dipeptide transport system permease protein
MLKFLLRRLALTVPTFIALMFVTFVAIRLVPGDPVEVRVGERGISAERLAQFRHELGLDQPVWKQFLDYMWALLHGDFGTSLATSQKVLTEFAALFPATLELSAAAMLLAVLLGIPAGTIAAARRGSLYDQTLMGLSVTGYSMPIFWWGLLLIMFVAERWGLTPVSGRIDLIKYYFEPVTGFMVIDAWLSGEPGALKGAAAPPGAAVHRAGHHPAGGDRAHDAVGDAGRAEARTTCAPPAPRAWPAARDGPARAAQRADPGDHRDRAAGGHAAGGAVLTETIFSWPGVGKWLIESICAATTRRCRAV